ncbi:Rho guanine nucleotide exchange factor [Entamoeba marina]
MSFTDKQEIHLIEWVRSHLPNITITNISQDFQNGIYFVNLACVICNKPLYRLSDKSDLSERVQNIEKAIDIFTSKYGPFEGVSSNCIANGSRDQILSFLWHMKRMRTFENQRRKQQHQQTKNNLKKFREKTRQMKSSANYAIEDKSNEQDGVIRKRAFTVMKGGNVEVTNVTIKKNDDEEFRSRAMSLLNPISNEKHKKPNKNVITLQPSRHKKEERNSTIIADTSNFFLADKLVKEDKKQKRAYAKRVSVDNQQLKLPYPINILNKTNEGKQALTTNLTAPQSTNLNLQQESNTFVNTILLDEFSKNVQVKHTEKIIQPQLKNVNDDTKSQTPPNDNNVKDFTNHIDHSNESMHTKQLVVQREVATFITFDESDKEKDGHMLDYSREIEKNENQNIGGYKTNVENCFETSTTDIIIEEIQPSSPLVSPDSTLSDELKSGLGKCLSSGASPGLNNEESDKETYLSFGDDDNDLQNCFIQRNKTCQTPPTEMDIKEIKKNVFIMGSIYYEVMDVVGNENVLKPVNFSTPHLVSTIQSILRSKILKNQYNTESIEFKSQLNNVNIKATNSIHSIVLLQARIRGYQTRNSSMWSKTLYLKKIMNEIVTTEQKYLEDVKVLKLLIERTIQAFPNVDIVRISKNVIETIIKCNTVFYNALLEMIETDHYGRTISIAFQTLVKYLNYYSAYMNIYVSLKTFYFSTSSKIASFVNKISAELLQDTHPDNYLIRLIQRPPRYKLLLNSVSEYYPTWWSSENKSLQICINKIKDSVLRLNSCMKRSQQTRNVEVLLKKLVFPKKFVIKKDASRQLIHQGFLKRVEKKEEVCCFLLSDVIILTKTKRKEVDNIPSESIKSKTKVTDMFDNRQITLMDIPDTPFAFCICVPGKHYVFQASSEEEKMTWMHDIDGIFALQQQQISKRITSLHTEIKLDLKEQLNVTEFLIHPEYEDSVSYFNQTTGEWEDFYMMLHGNVVCLFLNEVEAAILQQPTLVFDVLSLRFKGLLVCSKKYSFEMNYKNYTYIFASRSNSRKFIWLSLLRNAFYKNCQVHFDLHDFEINMFRTDLLKTWTVFDDIPFSDNDNYTYLRMLLLQPHNKICADCLTNKTSFVDIDYGVFICKECALLHKKCKHSKRDYSTVMEFEKCLDIPFIALTKLHEYGNARGTVLYSQIASSAVYKPSTDELQKNNVMRRRWTLAKYVDPTTDIVNFSTTLSY